MASITIRNLDQSTKSKLRIQAARKGRSMEEEIREILRMAAAHIINEPENLAQTIANRMQAAGGGVEIEEITRDKPRKLPDFKR